MHYHQFGYFLATDLTKKMMQGIPETAGLGLAYPSGWMTSQNFLKVLEYFVQNVHCSIENKVLLIMDNHDSHLSVDGLKFCKTNGIIILTLPPHTSITDSRTKNYL